MSRIFDALQRSGTEQSGVEYPDLVSVVTEVFEAPREQRPIADPPTKPSQLRLSGHSHEMSVQEPAVHRLSQPKSAVQVPDCSAGRCSASSTSSGGTTEAHSPRKSPAMVPWRFRLSKYALRQPSRLVFITEPDSLAAEKFRFLGFGYGSCSKAGP